jgi:DNA-3-methyladenine glycosylase I
LKIRAAPSRRGPFSWPIRYPAFMSDSLRRCPWCGTDPLYVAYHDEEWGVPEYDARALWEKLALDGFQAGLAWITILRKREGIREAFDGFDPEKVAAYGEADIARLLGDARIIRSRAKINSAIKGARVWLEMRDSGEDFSGWLWSFVGEAPIQNTWDDTAGLPARSPESEAMAKALKARGYSFCGPVIVYAFMQAVGMVNDHNVSCFRHGEVRAFGRS